MPKAKILDSNNLETSIHNVCWICGTTANMLTCLEKYGKPPKQVAYIISTYHKGKCDYCGRKDLVTEARDFFFPNFKLIDTVADFLYWSKNSGKHPPMRKVK